MRLGDTEQAAILDTLDLQYHLSTPEHWTWLGTQNLIEHQESIINIYEEIVIRFQTAEVNRFLPIPQNVLAYNTSKKV